MKCFFTAVFLCQVFCAAPLASQVVGRIPPDEVPFETDNPPQAVQLVQILPFAEVVSDNEEEIELINLPDDSLQDAESVISTDTIEEFDIITTEERFSVPEFKKKLLKGWNRCIFGNLGNLRLLLRTIKVNRIVLLKNILAIFLLLQVIGKYIPTDEPKENSLLFNRFSEPFFETTEAPLSLARFHSLLSDFCRLAKFIGWTSALEITHFVITDFIQSIALSLTPKKEHLIIHLAPIFTSCVASIASGSSINSSFKLAVRCMCYDFLKNLIFSLINPNGSPQSPIPYNSI